MRRPSRYIATARSALAAIDRGDDTDAPGRIDLAKPGQGNAARLLEDMEVPAGRYEWLHLHRNTRGREDTYLVLADDSVRELVVPSEGRDHLRIETPFEVPAGGEVKRTIDFHLHEPLGEKGPTSNTYVLRPILRSVPTETASGITATADRGFIARHCTEPHRSGLALYVFAGGDGAETDDPSAFFAGTGIRTGPGDTVEHHVGKPELP